MGKILTVAAGVVLFSACGGQSVTTEDDDDGGAGTGNASGTGGRGGGSSGNSGRGGGTSGSGGSSGSGAGAGAGGIDRPGGAGGTISFGGNAGTIMHPAGTGGGPPERCLQPIEGGTCLAYFEKFAFSASGYCQRFIYGGCDGNDNRFDTLEECETTCGGPKSAGCPDTLPMQGSACNAVNDCHYDYDECSCAKVSEFQCLHIDPYCPALPAERRSSEGEGGASADEPCTLPDCPSRVVVPFYPSCECSQGTWTCAL